MAFSAYAVRKAELNVFDTTICCCAGATCWTTPRRVG